MSGRYVWMEDECNRLDEQSLARRLVTVDQATYAKGALIEVNGRRLLNLSSNNYLGLAHDQRLIDASIHAVKGWGAGATASRLVSGNHAMYTELEQSLADWKEREGALVFANGYQANTGVISALAGRGDAIFSDRLNHASIVDGIILSRAEHYRYQHNDMEHLEYLLKKHQQARRKLIVTDSIFSMDGDMAPLATLVELKDRYGALMMVDEAHAGGVRGQRGEGLCHELGLQSHVDVIMGTFSKAFGAYGGYVCGDQVLIRYLLSKARSLIYSTALPPAVIASVQAALAIISHEAWRRERLKQNSLLFRQLLRSRGFSVEEGDTPIIPLIIGDNEQTIRYSQMLEERGIAAVAIRPPTVPTGTARIRFTVMATHTRDELEWAADQLFAIKNSLEGEES